MSDRYFSRRNSQETAVECRIGGSEASGFAALPAQERRRMASLGGAAVPPEKRSFSQDRALASDAGKRGGLARAAKGVGGRPQIWKGRRVEWIRGPYTGRTGTIVRTKSGDQFVVELDGARGVLLTPARTSVRMVDGGAVFPASKTSAPSLGARTNRAARVAAKVTFMFATMPGVERVIVSGKPGGYDFVQPQADAVPADLIAVYGRDVTLRQIMEDME